MTSNIKLYREVMRVSHLLRHGHGEPALKVAPGQQRVLTTLAGCGTMQQRDLVTALGTAPASMSELLAKLEEKNLIERSRSESDRRAILVRLTKKGQQQADKLAAAEQAVAAEVFGVLGASDREELSRILTLLAENSDSDK